MAASSSRMKILVTGNAGFIGFHTARKLLERGDHVVGLDNVNEYYDVTLKHARLKELDKAAAATGSPYEFIKADLADRAAMEKVFKDHQFDRVIHLAAQAGVRHSLTHPHEYTRSNVEGTLNVLEGCRHSKVSHLTYASTSSVYGANTKMPFSEHDGVDHPLALYAATKRACELMAHSYSHLYRLPTTGLRFFTVYGPWGRPDMALFLFTKQILAGQPIDIFNNGEHTRDFTYVDDIVEGVIRASDREAEPSLHWNSGMPDPATSNAPFRIFNIGNNNPVKLMEYVDALEQALGKSANKRYLPLQPGDVPATSATVDELDAWIVFRPRTGVKVGIARFIEWYCDFYNARP
jgi:UDP-glucuronate 4-epimerase